jgi:ribosomal protein S18 acetylase RimI-like enzyme
MIMVKATRNDLKDIEKLYEESSKALDRKQIFQWDEKYPNRETFLSGIEGNEQFLFTDGGVLIGSVILNEKQSPEWNEVNWKYPQESALIIHALTIDASAQGKGYGRKVLRMCEEFAEEKSYASIRLDVFSENPAAIGLYEKYGYEKVGAVRFHFKPVGHQEYHCYEKKL